MQTAGQEHCSGRNHPRHRKLEFLAPTWWAQPGPNLQVGWPLEEAGRAKNTKLLDKRENRDFTRDEELSTWTVSTLNHVNPGRKLTTHVRGQKVKRLNT